MWKFFEAYPFQTMLHTEAIVVVYDIDEGAISHGDNSLSWVTVYLAECANLSNIETFHAGEVENHSVGGVFQIFV